MFFLFFLSPTTLAMWIKESVKIAMAQGSGFHVPWPNADPQVGEIKALPSILSKRHLWSHTLLMSSETNEWVCMWCTLCTVHEGTSCIVSLINSQWFLMIQNPLEGPACGALEEDHEDDARILKLELEPLVTPALAKHMLTVRITERDSKYERLQFSALYVNIKHQQGNILSNVWCIGIHLARVCTYALKLIVCESSIMNYTVTVLAILSYKN